MEHVTGAPLIQAINLDLKITDIINCFQHRFKNYTTINAIFPLKNTTFLSVLPH
jgi:hypothetical protein